MNEQELPYLGLCVVADARQLSSGTIATLTSETAYEQIDRIRDEFTQFTTEAVENGVVFETWIDAWGAYSRV